MAELSHLPLVLQDVWSWQFEGACRQADSRLFFHPEGARGPSKAKREALALAYCERCPVLRACREQALSSREMYGVWGGLTEDERERRRAQNRRSVASVPSVTAMNPVTGTAEVSEMTELNELNETAALGDVTELTEERRAG